jgi:hypothetical protein
LGGNRQERSSSRLNDGFYKALMPRESEDFIYIKRNPEEGILIEKESMETREIIPLKFNEALSPNVSTAVAPIVFTDALEYFPLLIPYHCSLDNLYLHLFVPSKNMRPLTQLRPESFRIDQEWPETEEESFIELIAKVEGKRTIGRTVIDPEIETLCKSMSL